MCGSTAPVKPPPVVVQDPVAEQKKAEADAQQKANAETAARRKRMRGSSLLTSGARGSGPASNTLLAQANPGGTMKTGGALPPQAAG